MTLAIVWCFLFLLGPAFGAEPRITDIQLEADGRAKVTVEADPESYYILYRGEVVTDIRFLSQLGLGADGTVSLADAHIPEPASERFYRVEQVLLNAPKDSDGDGIDDVYELRRRTFLDPLVKVDPSQDTDGDGISDLEEYRQNTDPALANPAVPTISLISPSLGATYFAPGFVSFTATARARSEGAAVAKVEFFANTNRLGEGTPSTFGDTTHYQFDWNAVPVGEYVVSARVTDTRGSSADSIPSVIRVVNLVGEPLTTVSSSPSQGENGVAVTRETILRFSCPLRDDAKVLLNRYYAEGNGRRILSRVELSGDRRTATLFYLENLPASTRVRVTFDGNGIFDCLGREIDADGDGLPGGVGRIEFDTLGNVGIARTAVIGRVYASEPVPDPTGTTFTNRPLKGVTITVDGAEETLRAVTDAQGAFRLEPAPAGRFFVHVDGRTAEGSQWPDGAYYPFVGKAWEAVPGRSDNLAGGTGEIYLPLIPKDALRVVSSIDDIRIGIPYTIVSNNPELAGVSITVPANSLFADNGVRGGRVGIAPVDPRRLPEPLPPGLGLPIVFTVQTDGPMNFDQPAPVTLPNLPDPNTGLRLLPGMKSTLWSFSHDTGRWAPQGSMTVTSDGLYLQSDPGVGIKQPGWHGSVPRIRLNVCTITKTECEPITVTTQRPGTPRLPNGCGAEDGLQFPAQLSPCGSFVGACDEHDIAYDTCGRPRYISDIAMFRRMLQICSDGLASSSCGLAEYPQCVLLAHLYYMAVRFGGIGPWNSSQDYVCEDVEVNRCRTRVVFTQCPEARNVTSNVQRLSDTTDIDKSATQMVGPFVLSVYLSKTGEVVSRLFEDDIIAGINSLSLSPFVEYSIAILDLGANSVAWIQVPVTSRQGDYEVGTIAFYEADTGDTDNDGLSDVLELSIGFNFDSEDSDGDGILDGAEVGQWSELLHGRSTLVGTIGSLPVDGIAVDLMASGETLFVATSGGGVSIIDTVVPSQPVRIGRVDTIGGCLAIAGAGSRLVAAGGESGADVFDITDPGKPKLVRHIDAMSLGGGSINSTAVSADCAFVGSTSGRVSLVDMISGAVLQIVEIGSRVEDLAIEGAMLYVFASERLHVLPFSGGILQRAGVVDCPSPIGINSANGRGRLFVGGGIAFATHAKGYNTIDVRDPARPKLLSVGDSSQFGWKHVVANGSGRVLAAYSPNQGFDGPHDVGLFDSSDLGNGNMDSKFLVLFETPGIARAVTLYNGLAYVADHNMGLAVINHLPPDTAGRAPSGTLEQSVTGEVTIGGLVVLRAAVQDDVQVRNVEFFANGQRVALDGSFPFEYIYRVPTNSIGTSITFSALATDMGGNRLGLTNAPIMTKGDDQPPTVTLESPTAGSSVALGDNLFVRVSAVDNVDGAAVPVIWFELDGVPVDSRRLSRTEFMLIGPRGRGAHELRVIATDSAGNQGSSSSVPFTVYSEAISREVSLFDAGPRIPDQAVSREYSVFTEAGDVDLEAVSREVSLEVDP